MQPSIIVWAGIAAALCAAAIWRPWSRAEPAHSRPAWLGPVPVAIAVCVAYKGARGWPAFPPRELAHDLFYLAVASPLLALAGARLGRVVGSLAWAAAIGLVLWQGLEPFRAYHWEAAQNVRGHLGVFAGGMGLVLLGSGIERARPGGIAFPMLATIAVGAGAQALGQSTGATAHVAGGLAAACTVLLVLALWRPDLPTSRGAATVCLVLLGGLLSIGGLFAAVPLPSILIVLAIPALTFSLPATASGRRYVVVAILAAALAVAAVWLSVPSADPYGGYEGYGAE